ncbi:MAG: TIR domain-containing protein [Burkholderiales bacterium]|nr:TIR domain-containing protein [Burkholderiales bacterium]
MAARIFISYRSSDGKDKATALARDLGAVFGDAQVFLDKDDLRGGSRWRDEVQQLLDQRPVLLLLMTPQLLAATDDAGRLRIEDPDDPVRRELADALEANAQIVPLLCDGFDAPPAAGQLPPPFDQIGERTWRKLRAYDWQGDVQRLVDDLRAFGVLALAATEPVAASSANPRRVWLVAGMAGLVAAGVAVWFTLLPSAPQGIAGEWATTVEGQPSMSFAFRFEADKLVLTSKPVPVADRADWAEYRAFWRERSGAELTHVVYRGEGTLRADPGVPVAIDVALTLVSSPGDVPVDSGNLSARLAADGASMNGTLWLNSAQADRPLTLRRATR